MEWDPLGGTQGNSQASYARGGSVVLEVVFSILSTLVRWRVVTKDRDRMQSSEGG